MRSSGRRAAVIMATAAMLLVAPLIVHAQSIGLRAATPVSNPEASYYSGPMPFDPSSIIFSVEAGAHTFYFTAPARQSAPQPGASPGERTSSRTPGQTTAFAGPADWTAGYRYTQKFARDPALSIGYSAQMTLDRGNTDITDRDSSSEYLGLLEVARDFGGLTPRVELGYRYSPSSFFEPPSTRSAFAAAGLGYRYSDRSMFDVVFEQWSSPSPGMPALRNTRLNFTHRVFSRALLAVSAFRSLSEDKAYNALVKLSVEF